MQPFPDDLFHCFICSPFPSEVGSYMNFPFCLTLPLIPMKNQWYGIDSPCGPFLLDVEPPPPPHLFPWLPTTIPPWASGQGCLSSSVDSGQVKPFTRRLELWPALHTNSSELCLTCCPNTLVVYLVLLIAVTNRNCLPWLTSHTTDCGSVFPIYWGVRIIAFVLSHCLLLGLWMEDMSLFIIAAQ